MGSNADNLYYRRTFLVQASVERCFKEFTEPKGGWWPHDHQRGFDPVLGIAMESKVGGEWYERPFGGQRVHRGTILHWDPPHRLVVSWPLTMGQAVDLKTLGESELDVKFLSHFAGGTQVDLEHRHMQRTPDVALLAPFFTPYGWDLVVTAFSAYLASEPWPSVPAPAAR